MRLARSGCLIASSNHVRNSLCASCARPPSPRMLLRTLTCAPRMQYTKRLDQLIQTWEPCLREPVRLVRHKPVELPIGALPVSDESKNVSFVLPSPALVCKTLNRRVWQRSWRIGPLLKQRRTSVIVNDLNISQACPDECKIKTWGA